METVNHKWPSDYWESDTQETRRQMCHYCPTWTYNQARVGTQATIREPPAYSYLIMIGCAFLLLLGLAWPDSKTSPSAPNIEFRYESMSFLLTRRTVDRPHNRTAMSNYVHPNEEALDRVHQLDCRALKRCVGRLIRVPELGGSGNMLVEVLGGGDCSRINSHLNWILLIVMDESNLLIFVWYWEAEYSLD